MEVELQNVKAKNNQAVSTVKALKAQVDAARNDRVFYSNIFKKLESDIK